MRWDYANIFLKILEEPPESATFILLAPRPDDLLPTIRSRAITFRFAPVSTDQVEEFLARQSKLSPQERELAAIPAALEVPCLVNMVEGGVSPLMPAPRLEEMGYRIVIHANLALRAAARAVAHAFEVLRSEGSSVSLLDEILPWEERQRTVGLDSWRAAEQDVLARAAVAIAAGQSAGE